MQQQQQNNKLATRKIRPATLSSRHKMRKIRPTTRSSKHRMRKIRPRTTITSDADPFRSATRGADRRRGGGAVGRRGFRDRGADAKMGLSSPSYRVASRQHY